MFWSFCSSKGGVGTSVIAAAFARELAAHSGDRVVLVDFCGSQPDICGVDASESPGVVDWLHSSKDVDTEALSNLLLEVSPGLALLPRGTRPLPGASGLIETERLALLMSMFAEWTVVADIGVVDTDPISPSVLLVAGSDRAVAVVRSCYLALRQLSRLPVLLDGLVEVVEAGRTLRTLDIEAIAGRPVTGRIRLDPTIARCVDAGLILRRTPRPLRRVAADLRGALATRTPIGVEG